MSFGDFARCLYPLQKSDSDTERRFDLILGRDAKKWLKAAAVARWDEQASAYAAEVGSKPWRYLLVPHDEILESRQLKDYLRFKLLSS